MAKTLRVAIVDDHDMLRQALEGALAIIDDIEVVLAVGSVGEFASQSSGVEFDVVVADLELGDGTGKDIAQIATSQFDRPVLLMTGQGDIDGVQAAVDSGCAGFVSKGASVDDLVDAIRVVGEGGAVYPASLLQSVLAPTPKRPHGITDRELDVLTLLAKGMNAVEIADTLFVSVHTARNHIRALLAKLHARSQLEAVVRAARDGLVSIDQPSSGGD